MKDRHRSQLASVRLRPEEKALVEALAARQGSTVSALIHGLLRAEAFRQGLAWPGGKIQYGRPKKTSENSA